MQVTGITVLGGFRNTTETFCVAAEEFTDTTGNVVANNSIYDTGEVFVDANGNGEWDEAILDNCWAADKPITLGLEAGLTENVVMRIEAANKSRAVLMGGHHFYCRCKRRVPMSMMNMS